MNCPTKEQVLEAAQCKDVNGALRKLFPVYFPDRLKAGEMYTWGTASDGNSGIVIDQPSGNGFCFISFITGKVYIPYIHRECNKYDLFELLKSIKPLYFDSNQMIKGPFHFRSWSLK